jgi:hypothetical protein
MQIRIENQRLNEKKYLTDLFHFNYENHQNYKSNCCPAYSKDFNLYSKSISLKNNTKKDIVEDYFS